MAARLTLHEDDYGYVEVLLRLALVQGSSWFLNRISVAPTAMVPVVIISVFVVNGNLIVDLR
ncbi:MAG TPA: hypothetical protein VN666_11915 [Nitrospira sp.]|nr:hypothetical protein [Nitrospira sp.]